MLVVSGGFLWPFPDIPIEGETSAPAMEPINIWEAGSSQLVYLLVALITFGAPAVFVLAGATGGSKQPRPGRARQAQQRVEILADIGPTGVIILGVLIFGGLGFWWYLKCRDRPSRMVLRLTAGTKA